MRACPAIPKALRGWIFVAGANTCSSRISGCPTQNSDPIFMGRGQLNAIKLPSYKLSGEIEASESYFGKVLQPSVQITNS